MISSSGSAVQHWPLRSSWPDGAQASFSANQSPPGLLQSAAIWIALLLISAVWQLRGSCTAIAALALAAAVVARLFGVLRLNPPASIAGLNPQDLDLLVATGPGNTWF